MDAKAIATAGKPVLLIDTCSILDVMRDPTRETPRLHERQAGLDLLAAAEGGTLIGAVAQQVALEFAEHDQSVQDEANRALKNLRGQIGRVNLLSAILGAPGQLDLTHLDDHVARTRKIVGRWLTQLLLFKPDANVLERAIARMNGNIAPARRGKDSSKDCIVFETYLKCADMLRTEGLTAPIVFLSSNTREYLNDSNVLKTEIANDFAPLKVDYASNMALAKYQLGF
ncbi:MAG TPA: hypothetical protein VM689_07380 [Aliidongia sp.]|nr:hypothetical protein [Aliidongia sp.]